MDSFVYKCPSCGGKVNYIDNKWICEYCGNKYDAIFVRKEKKLPNIEAKKYKLYNYKCHNCNKNYVSELDKEASCSFCSSQSTEKGKEFIASKVIDNNIPLDEAQEYYETELRKTKLIKNKELYFKELRLQYYNCDLYRGCIKITYNGKSEKFIFVNLLIPNTEYDDYRFMYELGNIGISNSSILSNNNKVVLSLIENGNNINSFVDKSYDDDMVNECVETYMKKHRIYDINQIKVEKEVEIFDGVFIPMYTCEVEINNKVYHQYVFGNRKICKFKKNLFNYVNKKYTLIELPEIKNSLFKMRLFNILSKFFKICIVPFIMLSFMKLQMGDKTLLEKIGISEYIPILSVIICFLLYYITNMYYNYYEKTLPISKEVYYHQIVNNSNYVKKIGGLE